jgi:hypothetical protein
VADTPRDKQKGRWLKQNGPGDMGYPRPSYFPPTRNKREAASGKAVLRRLTKREGRRPKPTPKQPESLSTTNDNGGDDDATNSDDGGGDDDGSGSSNVPTQVLRQTRRTASLALRQSRSKAAAWSPPCYWLRAGQDSRAPCTESRDKRKRKRGFLAPVRYGQQRSPGLSDRGEVGRRSIENADSDYICV